jgi:hypothetical protein
MFGETTMRKSGGICAIGLAALLVSACHPKAPSGGPTVQGWNDAQRTVWRSYTQGSRLLPQSWAKALEQADSTAMFFDPDHITKLGYLLWPDEPKTHLPIGFTLDYTPDSRLSYSALHWRADQADGSDPKTLPEPWVGLNCAACHTAQISYGGKPLTIDGGPAMSDFQQLLIDLRASLAKTLSDPAKFDRFAKRVLAGKDKDGNPLDTAKNREMLTAALQKVSDHEKALGDINEPHMQYGYGRLDAFGHIYSKVAYMAAGADALKQPSDAPTSYPFLWGIPKEDKIQWNGIATNAPSPVGAQTFDVGALARNTGEVIGVFADLSLTNDPLRGYRSSVNVRNLVAFEQQLESLRPPPWPTDLFGDKGKINVTLRDQGKVLFNRVDPATGMSCASCHEPLDPNNPDDMTKRVKVSMIHFWDANPPKTDPSMACNADQRRALSGVLEGTHKGIFSATVMGPKPFTADLLTTAVAGVLLDQKGQVVSTAVDSLYGFNHPVQVAVRSAAAPGLTQHQADMAACMGLRHDILAYKARPLNGIWATAPYLHNGSVPNLWELFDPAHRSATFWVGSREYDPVRVGYVSKEGVGTKFDTSVPGNANTGHDYGTSSFTDAQRWALIEYLKTL